MPLHPSVPVEFRGIIGHPGYRVGSDGTVQTCWKLIKGEKRGSRSIQADSWRPMKLRQSNTGYFRVGLRDSVAKKTRYFSVHRLILEAFVGPCPDGYVACHNDGTRSNNRPENLRWDT